MKTPDTQAETPWPRIPVGARVLLLGVAYFGCALLGDFLSHSGKFVNFWLPGGLLVATLLLHEPRQWPWLVLAAVLANLGFDLWNGQTARVSLLFGGGNSLEALAGAWLVRRFVTPCPRFDSRREVLGFVFFSALLSTTLSASVGASVVSGWLGGGSFWSVWLLWWSGDAMGVLLLAPLVLSWLARPGVPPASPAQRVEALILLAGLSLVAVYVFRNAWHPDLALEYLMIPFVLWAALRFDVRLATLASLVVALIAAWSAAVVSSHLATVSGSPRQQVAALQLYLGVMALTGLFLAAVTAESKRAQAEKSALEAQNRQLHKTESLGRMAGAIAHHFNNLLGAVMVNLDLATRARLRNEDAFESLTEAMRATRKAAEVSNLMLTYLGYTRANRQPLDLSEACRKSLSLLRSAMPQHVVLETDLPCPGPAISADANQILQVLANLITNAREALADSRGAIRLVVTTVSAEAIPVRCRFPIDWQPRDPTYVRLEVADTGCGMADAEIERLFDPFFSTKFVGRGLGLPVVLGIVRAHDGVVAVTSAPGRGSVFQVFLPVSAEPLPQPPEPALSVPKVKWNGAMLLVEDEQNLRKAVAAALQGLGFTVLAAKDGVEAVELFRRHPDEIRFVLCDLTMPRMNGWETLDALRKLKPNLPIILSSGYNEAQVMAGDHPEQPQVFLSKPYEHEELVNVIGQVLVKKDI